MGRPRDTSLERDSQLEDRAYRHALQRLSRSLATDPPREHPLRGSPLDLSDDASSKEQLDASISAAESIGWGKWARSTAAYAFRAYVETDGKPWLYRGKGAA